MCGRFGLEYGDDFYPRFKIKNLLPNFKTNFNISPGQEVPIITLNTNANYVQTMKWGFVPSWADDPKIGYKMFNARVETIQEKPTFRTSFGNRRCIIPASFFYEWKDEDGKKTPYCIKVKDEKFFAMAGIFSLWTDLKTKTSLNTFSILTSSSNDELSPVHERMPVILKPEEEVIWLEKGNDPYVFLDITKDTLDIKFEIAKLEKDFVFGQNNNPAI
jgi:putative SOS response-associated peptidase YedK